MTPNQIKLQESETDNFRMQPTASPSSNLSKAHLYQEMLKSAQLKIKLLTKENRRLNALVSQNSAAKQEPHAAYNELFSVISHDLRSPLSSILNLTKMIVNQPDGFGREEMIKNFKNFESSFDNMYRLVENMLYWSSLQLSKNAFKPEINPLSQVVVETIEITEQRALEKNIKIVSKVDPADFFCADYNMVAVVLRNLIYNAIKFSLPNGQIEIATKMAAPTITIYVKDHGVGIPKSARKKIFSTEHRFYTSGTQGECGTGIGLSLCKNMLESIGGEIDFDSIEGKGSCFFFTLPTER